MFLFPWYAALCAAQGLLVAAPAVGREAGRRHALLGLAGPAAAMIVGVGLIRVLGGSGASFLAYLGTIATPALAAALGRTANWPRPYLTVVAAAVLYVVAWQATGHVAEIAGALLIGGACLAIASIVGPITPARYLAIGLIVLIGVDVYLVWGTTQVKATSVALQNATLPHIGVDPPLPAAAGAAAGRPGQLEHGLAGLPRSGPARGGRGPAHPPPSPGGRDGRGHGAGVGVPARGHLPDPGHRPGPGGPGGLLAAVVEARVR